MEKVEKETEPAVNSQSSQNEGIYAPKDYRQSILAYLTEYKVETYQYFPTITEKTFPCVYQTKRNMYKNRHTFVVETEPGGNTKKF